MSKRLLLGNISAEQAVKHLGIDDINKQLSRIDTKFSAIKSHLSVYSISDTYQSVSSDIFYAIVNNMSSLHNVLDGFIDNFTAMPNIIPDSIKGFDYLNGYFTTSRGWNLSNFTYDCKFSVGEQESSPWGLEFSDDGTHMYMVGSSRDRIYQYHLSVPWDIKSAYYDNVSFYIGKQDTLARDLCFNEAGTKLYILGDETNCIYQYTLSTPWDISSIQTHNIISLDISDQDINPRSITFSRDGSKLFLVGIQYNRIYQYTLLRNYDLSTAEYDNRYFAVQSDNNSFDIIFDNTGTNLFVLSYSEKMIYHYQLSTPYDISTINKLIGNFAVQNQDTHPTNITFGDNGTKMYLLGNYNDTIYQYSTPSFTEIASLESKTVETEDAPSTIFAILHILDIDTQFDLTKDLIFYISCNNGVNYIRVPLNYVTSRVISGSFSNIPIQIRGTKVRYKIEVRNNKNINIYSVGLQWR